MPSERFHFQPIISCSAVLPSQFKPFKCRRLDSVNLKKKKKSIKIKIYTKILNRKNDFNTLNWFSQMALQSKGQFTPRTISLKTSITIIILASTPTDDGILFIISTAHAAVMSAATLNV